MWDTAFRLWRGALSQGAVWTVLIWLVLFGALLGFVLVGLGAGAMAALILHPVPVGTGPAVSRSAVTHAMSAILGMYVIVLAVGPFVTAGSYGVLSGAITGAAVTWRTFWTLGVRHYRHGWGLFLFIMLWIIALVIVAAMLGSVLHGVGVALAILAAIASGPYVVRMVGGLFVDNQTWIASFRGMFRGAGYGFLLAATVVGFAVYTLISLIGFTLAHALGVVGLAVEWAMMLAMGVAGPLWFFSIYRASLTP